MPEAASPAARPLRGAFALLLLLSLGAVVGGLDLRAYEATEPLADAPYGDSLVYLAEAERQFGAEGDAADPPGAFYKPPLYTALVAAFDAETSEGAARLRRLQVLLGLLTLACVFLLARARGGDLAGLLGGLLLLGYAPFAFHQTKLLDSVASFSLTATAFVLVDRLLRKGGGGGLGLVAGLVLGAAALTRAANLVFLPLAFAFDRERSGRRTVLLFLAGALLPVTATTVWNRVHSGDWVPVNYSEGHTFLVGHHPQARGIYSLPPGYPDGVGNERQVERAIARDALGRDPSPAEQRDHSYRTALRYVRDDPGAAWSRTLDKLRFAIDPYPVNDNYSLGRERDRLGLLGGRLVPFPLLLVLGLAGLLLPRSRPRLPLLLPIAVTFLLLLVFYVGERYRLPAAPFLAAAGGVGLAALGDPRARGRFLIGAVGVTAAGLLFAWARPLPASPEQLARSELVFDVILDLHAGRARVEAGDVAGAARALARGVADRSGRPGAAELESAFLALLHGRGAVEVAEIAVAAREVAAGQPRVEAMLRMAGAPPPLTGEAGR